jgi:hypothetical protein
VSSVMRSCPMETGHFGPGLFFVCLDVVLVSFLCVWMLCLCVR